MKESQDGLHIHDKYFYKTVLEMLRDLKNDLKNIEVEVERIRRISAQLSKEKETILSAIADMQSAVDEFEKSQGADH